MPTFREIPVSYYVDDKEVIRRIDLDFEVYCGTCGAGLCNESYTRTSRNRGYLQVLVNACPKCMREKDFEIERLESEIKYLKARIKELE